MALFSRTKKKTEETASAASTTPRTSQADFSHILKQPRITEKATMAAGMSVYVFDVAPRATKQEIKKAVERYYKVTPRMVRVVTIPTKYVRNMRTGQRGVSEGGKKAYVYLKKGEMITLS